VKKNGFYILVAILIGGFLAMLLSSKDDNPRKRRRLDDRITLSKRDKIPYGMFVAYENLNHLFPSAKITAERSTPGFWDSLVPYENKQALLIISGRFYANETEMERLIEFAKGGNHVFISAREFSVTSQDLMGLRTSISFG
jgi:hypothetical protein